MEYREKHYATTNMYLAHTLSFLGFRFMKFTNEQGETVFSFNRTPEFQKICDEIHKMKKEIYYNK